MKRRFVRGTIFGERRFVLKRRFVRGTVLGKDASYEEALCEKNRFGERRFV